MHLLIQGSPGVGKTTLIKELLKKNPHLRGFYTEEIREKSKRLGFKVRTLLGEEAIFAHINFSTPFKVSQYKVDIDTFNRIAVKELNECLSQNCEYLVIDEIGKMELFSEKFKQILWQILQKKKTISTIPLKGENPFLEKVKSLSSVTLLQLTKENFSQILNYAQIFLNTVPLEEIRKWEERAKKAGLSERILIENASYELTSFIEKLNLGKKGMVIAGRGNNGADTLSCARKLLGKGYQVEIAILNYDEAGEEVKFQVSILEKIKKIHFVDTEEDLRILKSVLKNKDFILDGILGIGIKGEPAPFIKKVIEQINASKSKTVACDIPSGLSPRQGAVHPFIVKADYTVTFIAPKEGFFLNKGLDFCGEIFVADIGISRQLLEKLN